MIEEIKINTKWFVYRDWVVKILGLKVCRLLGHIITLVNTLWHGWGLKKIISNSVYSNNQYPIQKLILSLKNIQPNYSVKKP